MKMHTRRTAPVLIALCVLATAWWLYSSPFSSDRRRLLADLGPVTYHGDVHRILQSRCWVCHRAGGIAPFPLEEYSQAYAVRVAIADAVATRRMPPWFADPAIGQWANDRSLTEEERLIILAWIDQGAPEGIGDGSPPPVALSQGWNIGRPDTVLELENAVRIPARGVLPYRYEYVETGFAEDRWIQAMEIRPSAPEIVHHVLVLIEDRIPGASSAGGRVRHPDFGLGLDGYFAAYVPGHLGVTYPDGHARLLPKGATLKFQLHYTPHGRAAEDRTQIGFIFADVPPKYRVETGAAIETRFVIPPGARNHEVSADHLFEASVHLLGFLPHMHLRGSAFRYELLHEDGSSEVLLRVPRYDFNWQDEYILENPVRVEAGSRLRATGWFDNSRRNPHNPDPTQPVRFGEQTYEEMMNGYFHYVIPVEAPRVP